MNYCESVDKRHISCSLYNLLSFSFYFFFLKFREPVLPTLELDVNKGVRVGILAISNMANSHQDFLPISSHIGCLVC